MKFFTKTLAVLYAFALSALICFVSATMAVAQPSMKADESELTNLNDHFTFDPIPSSYKFTSNINGILFQDDFNDGNNLGWTTTLGEWDPTSGYNEATELYNGRWAYSYAGDPSWDNYTLDVDITFGAGNTEFIVAVRVDPSSSPELVGGRQYYLSVDGDNNVIRLRYTQEPSGFYDLQTVPYNLLDKETYHIRISIFGNNLIASIDGNPLFDYTFSGTTPIYSNGAIGIGYQSDDGPDGAYFDNVLVEAPGCPSSFAGKFSFDATLTNIGEKDFSNLNIEVTELTNYNLLYTSNGLIGEGERFKVPKIDDYADGVLRHEEAVTIHFEICLKYRSPFSFFVDVYGEVWQIIEEWPNSQSNANSDPWLAEHHQNIKVMRPRILALNFVNSRSMADMHDHFTELINILAEASRYHGYSDESAHPFLQYDLAYEIDMRDDPVPPDYPYINSTKYPREIPREEGWDFDYEKLFTQEFAEYYGIGDPNQTGSYLTLNELIDRGLVHEIWIYIHHYWLAQGDAIDAVPAEILELKPYYDETRQRIDGAMNRCAGNGCFDWEDDIPSNRTVRILAYNHQRGPGCFLENMAHGMEWTGLQPKITGLPNIIPYLSDYFPEFANAKMDELYGTPFNIQYKCPMGEYCYEYPNETSMNYEVNMYTGLIENYDPVCGNAHFPSNARRHYDLESLSNVLTSCVHFRDGTGAKEVFYRDSFASYLNFAPDCMGPFLVWWLQNIPGLNNNSLDDDGQQMLNWWVFLYY